MSLSPGARLGVSSIKRHRVSPDGTRFLTLQPPDPGPPQFMVVTNWFAEVARLVSGRTR